MTEFAGPRQVLDYVGRYTHRVAISNNRLLSIDNGKVCFRWKDYRRDNHLGTFRKDGTVVAARAADAARAHLRVDQFAGAAFTDGYRKLAQHPDHFEVGRIEIFLVRHQNLGQE